MSNWSQKNTPLWPSKEVIYTSSWRNDQAWTNGPGLKELIYELLPVVRALFLLGHRVPSITIVDLINYDITRESPQEGYLCVNLETGEKEYFDFSPDLGEPGAEDQVFVNDRIHIIFNTVEISDTTGYLYLRNAASGDASDASYQSYGYPLRENQTIIYLSEVVDKVADLHKNMSAFITPMIETLKELWRYDESEPGSEVLSRRAGGGMLWVFDPVHWGAINHPAADDVLPTHDFRTPKNLVNRLTASENPNSNFKESDGFIIEQVFDLSLSAQFFAFGVPAGEVDDCLDQRSKSRPQYKNKPNLAHYNYSGSIPVGSEANGIEAADIIVDIAQREINAQGFIRQMMSNVNDRGLSHIWSEQRYTEYAGTHTHDSWLDMIITLAWEGAVSLPDVVPARIAPDALKLERKKTASIPNGYMWTLRVFETHEIRFRLSYESQYAGGRAEDPLVGKVAWDYKAGSRGTKPKVLIVASRGVDIVFTKMIRSLEDYNRRGYPWELEIYRVQSDHLVPVLGTDINPIDFMGTAWINPSPDNPDSDLKWDPLVKLVFPINSKVNDLELIELGVQVQPKPYGVRIEFPASRMIQSGKVESDNQSAESSLYQTTDSVAYWEISVDPFSGKQGYTYDMYLGEVATKPTMINLHLVIWVTDGVSIKTNAEAVDNTLFNWLFSKVSFNEINANTSEYPGAWPLDNYLLDATAEFWKVKSSDLYKLPVPMGEKLPVSTRINSNINDAIERAIQDNPEWEASSIHVSLLDERLEQVYMGIQAPFFFNQEAERTFIDGWVLAQWGNNSFSLKRLESGDWEGASNDGLYLLVDLTLGFIPVIGDVVDTAEMLNAWITGYDRWGRPVNNFDLLLMTLGAMAPFVSSSALRGAKTITEGRLAATDVWQIADGKKETLGDLLRQVGGLFDEADDVDEAGLAALYQMSETLLDFKNRNKSLKNTSEYSRRSKEFADELIKTENRVVIQSYIERLHKGSADDSWLTVDEIYDKRKGEKGGFRFHSIEVDYQSANGRYKEANDTADDLPVDEYFEKHCRGYARVIAEVLLGSRNVGMRGRARKVNYPTAAGRAVRIGSQIAVSQITGPQIKQHVRQYFSDIVSGERILVQAAGYGNDMVVDAKKLLEKLGYYSDELGDIDDANPMMVIFDQMLTHNGTDLQRLLGKDIVKGDKLSIEERGARIGEALLLAIDQLIDAGITELQGGARTLDELYDGRLNGEVTSFIRQFVARTGYEHSLKTELVSAARLEKKILEINGLEPGDNLRRDFNRAGIDDFSVIHQRQLPSRDGKKRQTGTDHNVFVRKSNGEIVDADFQDKAYSSYESVAGMDVLDFTPVRGLRLFGGGIPKVIKAGTPPVWQVRGGSPIFHQLVKNRLRKAHWKGWVPGPTIGNPPPLQLPPNPGANGWVRAGKRHVFTIDDIYLANEIMSKLGAARRKLPKTRRNRLYLEDMTELTQQEKLILRTAFPEFDEKIPGTDRVRGLDLTGKYKDRLYDGFTRHKVEVRNIIEEQLQNYESEVAGLKDALREIGKLGGDALIDTHQTKIVFASDESYVDALKFVAEVDEQ